MPLCRLSYASLSRIEKYSIEMLDICRSSLSRNRRLGISGILYFDGKHFFQVLEGDADALETVFTSIRADGRHFGVVPLTRRNDTQRGFGGAPMRFIDADRIPELRDDFPYAQLAGGDRDMLERVERLLAAL